MFQYLNRVYNARVKYIQDHQPGVPLLGDVRQKEKNITKQSLQKHNTLNKTLKRIVK